MNITRSYSFCAVKVRRATRGMCRSIGETVHLLDSPTTSLSSLSASWARFSHTTCGAKLRLCSILMRTGRYAAITPCRINDIIASPAMSITPGATYVFDPGYYEFTLWAKLDVAQCCIVIRLKANTPLTEVRELDIPEDVRAQGMILSDRIGHLSARLKRSRHNPLRDLVREVRMRLDSRKVLRIVSNDIDAPAQEVADLSKRRWPIDLFFKRIKRTLRITHFLGTSENAVRIQVIVALIAFNPEDGAGEPDNRQKPHRLRQTREHQPPEPDSRGKSRDDGYFE